MRINGTSSSRGYSGIKQGQSAAGDERGGGRAPEDRRDIMQQRTTRTSTSKDHTGHQVQRTSGTSSNRGQTGLRAAEQVGLKAAEDRRDIKQQKTGGTSSSRR